MSVSDTIIFYIYNAGTNEVLNMSKDFEEQEKRSNNIEDNDNNFPKALTEDEKKELYEKINEIEDYDPPIEEVRKMYSDEFNKKWDNYFKK